MCVVGQYWNDAPDNGDLVYNEHIFFEFRDNAVNYFFLRRFIFLNVDQSLFYFFHYGLD